MTELNLHSFPKLKTYDQDHLRQIGLPLGGIGTGVVSLGGRGNLHDWEIVNRPAKGFDLEQSFFALYTRDSDGATTTRALEGVIPPADYEGARGATIPNHGLPRFRHCSFDAAYPFGKVMLSDPDVPLRAELEAFNPLIPADSENSGIPVAILRFILQQRGRKTTLKPRSAAACKTSSARTGPVAQPRTTSTPTAKRTGWPASSCIRPAWIRKSPQWGTLALTTLIPPSIPPSRQGEAVVWASSPHPDGGTEGVESPIARPGLTSPGAIPCSTFGMTLATTAGSTSASALAKPTRPARCPSPYPCHPAEAPSLLSS